MAKVGRPKEFERTVKVALTGEQWAYIDQMAAVMGVSFAECVRMTVKAQLAPFFEDYNRERANA